MTSSTDLNRYSAKITRSEPEGSFLLLRVIWWEFISMLIPYHEIIYPIIVAGYFSIPVF